MKIDLHCHTKSCKIGDGSARMVKAELFTQKIEEAGVKIVAITNHNHFDIKQYEEFSNSVKDFCELWPGIELDVKEKGSKCGHVLVIVSPNKIEEFDTIVKNNVMSFDADSFCISVTKLCKLFNPLEAVYIPHYFKTNQLSEDDLNLLMDKVYKKTRVLREPSDVKSLGILNANGFVSIIGSDVKDWQSYEKYKFAETKYEIKGFENFVKLLDKDISFVTDLLSKEIFETVEVYGDFDKGTNPFSIDIYKDINIIFGEKGSGKTEILKSLKTYFETKKGLETVYYTGGDKAVWFSNLIKDRPSDYSTKDLGFDNLEDIIEKVKNFKDNNPVNITNYVNYFKSKTNNKNRKKLKIISQDKIYENYSDELNALSKEYISINSFINNFYNLHAYIKSPDKYSNLLNGLKLLKNETYELYFNAWLKDKTKYLVNNAIEKIDSYAAESDGTPEIPKETGFYSFAKNRVDLYKNVSEIDNHLNSKEKTLKREYIGDVGKKGIATLQTHVGLVNSSNIKQLSSASVYGKKKTINEVLKYISNIKKSIFELDLPDNISNISELFINENITNIDYFIYNTHTFCLNNKIYHPSRGEMAILSLQYELLNKTGPDVYLIDEPEVNLGSTYIEETIVPKIRDLGKAKKIVVIATHDANIATRTYPITSILKVADNDVYNTYQGSMFTNQLINIFNEEDILLWDEESEKYLEGGNIAFIERGNLYGENN